MEQVSTTVEYVPDPMTVLHDKKKLTSTSVDSTHEVSEEMNDSIFILNPPIKTCVEIINNFEELQTDFECELDTNSEISFIDDLNAVE